MNNFFKKLIDWLAYEDVIVIPVVRARKLIEQDREIPKASLVPTQMSAPLLLAAPDPDRWIESDFFAHCIVHSIEERLEALIAKPKLDIFDTAIEIAELEATYNRLLPKLINYKHDPMRVRIRAVDPGDSTSSV